MNGTFIGVASSGFGELQNSSAMAESSLSNPSSELLDAFGGRETISGVRVNTRTVLGYPAFWRGVNIIADTVARLPLQVKALEDDGGTPIAKKHPAYRLLRRRPNAAITSRIFRRTVTLHALTHGNGYAYINRDQRGNPVELTILDPRSTYPVKWIPAGSDETEIWYITSLDDELVKIPASDVFHIRHLSEDGLIGISVVDRMKEAIGMGLAVRQFGAHFFGNGSNASGVLMVPGTIRPEAQKNLLDRWAKTVAGMKNSHKVALVQNGTKFQKLSFSPDEAQFLETKRFELIEIALIIGVPPHKLGDNSRNSYNSIEAENRSALDESYEPWLGTWEDECEAKLLTEAEQDAESHIIRFDRSKMLQPTLTERASANRTYREIGVLTINDILRSEGLETIGPEGDVRNIPTNWMQVGQTSMQGQKAILKAIAKLSARIDQVQKSTNAAGAA